MIIGINMSKFLLRPINAEAAWYGPELKSNKSWIYNLSNNEVSELELAVKAVQNIPLRKIRKGDFKLNLLKKRISDLRKSVDEGLGIALIKGIPVDRISEGDTAKMLWGIGQHIGVPQPQDASNEVLHHVRDTGDKLKTNPNLRIYQTNGEQSFHTDGGDLVMLLCRQAAKSGGTSRMASAVTVFNEVISKQPELAVTLQEPFYFDARGQQLAGQPPIQKVPIYVWHSGRLNALHKRPYIELCQRFENVPRITGLQKDALDLIDGLCSDPQISLSFDMEPGDIQVVSNFSVFHARDAFIDYSDPKRKRHMLRLWLGLLGGRELPDVYATTREFGPLFGIPGRSKL